MGFEIEGEGARRAHNQKNAAQKLGSASVAGGNLGLTTGGSAGTETGIEDACAANELRLRGNSAGENRAMGGAYQHGSPR